jgi:hypothetical protein
LDLAPLAGPLRNRQFLERVGEALGGFGGSREGCGAAHGSSSPRDAAALERPGERFVAVAAAGENGG